jgi:hypothetical protein
MGHRPANSVVKLGLTPTTQQFSPILLTQLKFIGQPINSLSVGVFLTVSCKRQKWQHYALEIWNRHGCHLAIIANLLDPFDIFDFTIAFPAQVTMTVLALIWASENVL